MKPARFVYHAPSSVEDALVLLATHGDEAKALAGGQSLVPLLSFRLAQPRHLVDLNGIAPLESIVEVDGALRIGAMTRQRTIERSELVRSRAPLVAQAMPFVGHPQIRNRGTLGGSLAHADPAAELPAVMVALDASLTLRASDGERAIPAEDFFVSYLTTALRPDELLVWIDVPAQPPRTGSSVLEVERQGDFALGGVATTLTLGRDGRIAAARIVCFGVDERPRRIHEAEALLIGAAPTESVFADAARVVSERLDPPTDIHASGAYRKRLAGVLTRRALAASIPAAEQVA